MDDPLTNKRLSPGKRILFLGVFGGLLLGTVELIAHAVDAFTYVSVAKLREVYQERRDWRLGLSWPIQRGDYPYLPYVLNSDFPEINDLGFKGEPVEREKPPGTYRILCLGGSTTFNGYPAYLEKALRDELAAQGLELEVINLGNVCWTTMESLINFIARGLPLDPDAVIVYHAVNDAVYSYSDAYSPDYSNIRKRLDKDDPLIWDYFPSFLDHSVAYVGFRAIFERKVGQRGIGVVLTQDISGMKELIYQGMEPFHQNLITLASITRRRNILLFISTQIFNREANKKFSLFDRWATAVDDANEITRHFSGYGPLVHLIDTASDLHGDNSWMTDYCHFTEDGKKRLADYMADHIAPRLHKLTARSGLSHPMGSKARPKWSRANW